jgi:hypothetical protein
VIDLAQDVLAELRRLAREAPRDAIPGLLGGVTEAEALLRVRLLSEQTAPAPAAVASAVLDVDQAVAICGTSKRWLLAHTRGAAFRRDLSRKMPRFDETGLRRWLAERRSLAK